MRERTSSTVLWAVRPQTNGEWSFSPVNGAPDLAELLQALDRGEKIFVFSEQAFPNLLAVLRTNPNGETSQPSQMEISQTPILNKKQKQVLFLLFEGLPNQEIACELGLTVRNTRARVSDLLARFNVKRRGELVFRAVKLGLVVPQEQFPALRTKAAGTGR